ncbi:hypothetical protein AB0M36_09065 [Actinoplanes sp. NPDC051346]|uniref:hypothetical protein n=1 Tax=Actinoplanes sp. NPDC051346 TaxID=3155048 RepID=UPI003437A89D
MTLEAYYRRLLAVYPREHRLAYEEEMIGVLMAGAEPDRRRPTAAEAADLLWSGLAARLIRGGARQRGTGWRDAAAVVGVLTAGLLTATAARRLVGMLWAVVLSGREFPFAYALSSELTLRTAAWSVVVVAALAGLRRAAACMAAVATAIEIGAIIAWNIEWRWVDMGWLLILAPLTVVLLTVARPGRTATAVLGRGGVTLIAGGVGLACVAAGLFVEIRFYEVVPVNLANVALAGFVIAGVLLLAGLWRARSQIRPRLVVMVVAVLAVPFAQDRFEQFARSQLAFEVTWDIVLTQVIFLVGLPSLAVLTVLGGWTVARRMFPLRVSR